MRPGRSQGTKDTATVTTAKVISPGNGVGDRGMLPGRCGAELNRTCPKVPPQHQEPQLLFISSETLAVAKLARFTENQNQSGKFASFSAQTAVKEQALT